ncbi:substrate-binding domain-containing protein [Phaeobacter sp. B1627]|uniref:substrate-binding domain-containing protein n=1 Tax=Phaeobacter sp. B1627 TaxID=2583809 RepID=UPI00111A1DF2|nr:substrate-binding domain-containing protein [Phaeobacter sp. B1627]TNJ47493.1 sulfate transporter [Phaeobacter sp. B1627]
MKLSQSLCASIAALALAGSVAAADQSIIVQSTTSTANSGLYDYLLPLFQDKTDIQVNVVAVGTGQAIKNAQNCDGDVLLVHAKASELDFVEAGYGTARTDLMYNDFVIVGPEADPAAVGGTTDAQAAFAKIAASGALFASRGDESGTHKKEKSLWAESGVDPSAASGQWYRETGSGMGATLNAGIGMGAYVMTDRATWISFGNKQDYKIQVEGDDDLFNQYGVIPVNPAKCPSVHVDAAKKFTDWLISDEGQSAIAAFEVGNQQLFFPNAPKN